jgi:hypothetical protein
MLGFCSTDTLLNETCNNMELLGDLIHTGKFIFKPHMGGAEIFDSQKCESHLSDQILN